MEAILNDPHLKHFVAQEDSPVCKLEVASAFSALTDKEKNYAHYLNEASWAGVPIVLAQCSAESIPIFKFLVSLFEVLFQGGKKNAAQLASSFNVPQGHVKHLLEYAGMFFGNMGNYKSFGDSKFIPRLAKSDFEAIVKASKSEAAAALFAQCADAMYSLKEDELELGFASKEGHRTCSTYYSPNVSKGEAQLVQEYMDGRSLSAYNTRLFKTGDKQFELRIASSETKAPETVSYQDIRLSIVYGDFAAQMKAIAENIKAASAFAANPTQISMLGKYYEHFVGGDIEKHMDSQRFWVQDKGPVVETNIGFIESYRDPLGVRGEWEGFVAMVNKEQSAKFGTLVQNAEKFIAQLPWNLDTANKNKPFEKEVFHMPDFTSLDVLGFASSGIPAGINIPNYDNIRQKDGFKNVSLGNVLNAVAPAEEITFLSEQDKDLYKTYRGKSFEVQVAIHELLGHGSGKLLLQSEISSLVSPLTGSPVSTYYNAGETYPSKFGAMASTYEECRAESVGIFLSLQDEILRIFGHADPAEAEKILYINWLHMCRAGLLGLEFYNPESKKWGQAHMNARYVILRVLLEAGNDFVTLKQLDDDLLLTMDSTKIRSVGYKAMYDFLLKLNVYKATADLETATKMYNAYSEVTGEWLNIRKIVLAKKKPRRLYVQPQTIKQGASDVPQLKEFDASNEGIIESFLSRKFAF